MGTHLMIWTFPLRRRGLVVFAAGSALVVLSTALSSISIPALPVLIGTLVAFYTATFAYLIVRDTSRGADTLVTWPGLPNREIFFLPIARVLIGALWSCLPALLYRIFAPDGPIWIFWLLFLVGAYFLPMVLVRVGTRESFLAGLPVAVLICILRTLRIYTLTSIPFYVAVFSTAFAATVLAPKDEWTLATLCYVLALYLILVEFYMLGLFHRGHRKKLHLTPFPTAPEEEARTAPAKAPVETRAPEAPAPTSPEVDETTEL